MSNGVSHRACNILYVNKNFYKSRRILALRYCNLKEKVIMQEWCEHISIILRIQYLSCFLHLDLFKMNMIYSFHNLFDEAWITQPRDGHENNNNWGTQNGRRRTMILFLPSNFLGFNFPLPWRRKNIRTEVCRLNAYLASQTRELISLFWDGCKHFEFSRTVICICLNVFSDKMAVHLHGSTNTVLYETINKRGWRSLG